MDRIFMQAFNSTLKIYHCDIGHGYILRTGLRDLFFLHSEICCERSDLQRDVLVTYTKGLYRDRSHNMRLVAKSIILTPQAYMH